MKKLIALLLAIMLAIASSAAFADTKITVKGTGEVRVSADTAVISLGVNARDKDVLTAQQKVNESIAAIRQALIDHGVKEENINTEFINIYAIYDYNNDQEQLAAYNASSTLAIRVTDMESVGTLIDICFAAGANTLNGISFSASDTEEANTEALKKAVADAIKKAEIMAESAGLKITGIEVISEGGVVSYENSVGNVYAKGFEMSESEEDAGTVVQAAKLIITASVSITFTAE
ncbi:MAG: SIMPL domain-containing protein [Clostridia bacterium]|nr:SIMPL domain-containing protein [Clostridia bacterium]